MAISGEAVVIKDGSVFVDGSRLDENYLPDGAVTSTANAPNKCTEQVPCVIPSGQVWVMGDNRGDSKDSRYFGPIEKSSIVGRAFITVWPLGHFGLL